MCPHPPKRGSQLLGTCPMVHTGFHKAWTASGLHTEVISYLQVLDQAFVHTPYDPAHVSVRLICLQAVNG